MITGYWKLPVQPWKPPPGIESFIEHSPQNTIAVGLGSPGTKHFFHILNILDEALLLSKTRAVLTIPARWHPYIKSERICTIEHAPHEWLYRRVRVSVHHGGAGTTSASLHAGIPTVTLPLAIDQFFWGERMYKIGVGARPIPQRSLSAEKLTHAIQQLLRDDCFQETATRIRDTLNREDGVQSAVRALREVV